MQPRGLRQPADQVRVLHRLSGRSLPEIVDHAHCDHQVALRVGRLADEGEVRADGPLGLRRLGDHADERPPGIEATRRVQALLSGGAAAAVDGDQDAAGHRHQMGREHQSGCGPTTQSLDRLGHLGHVDVLEQ